MNEKENDLKIESVNPYVEDLGDWIDREFDAFAEQHGVTCRYTPFALAAKKNGTVVGVVKGHSFYREVHVGELIVAEGYRGQGIGTRLLSAAEALFQGRGFLSRISDAVFRRLDKQKSSSINWCSSKPQLCSKTDLSKNPRPVSKENPPRRHTGSRFRPATGGWYRARR